VSRHKEAQEGAEHEVTDQGLLTEAALA